MQKEIIKQFAQDQSRKQDSVGAEMGFGGRGKYHFLAVFLKPSHCDPRRDAVYIAESKTAFLLLCSSTMLPWISFFSLVTSDY